MTGRTMKLFIIMAGMLLLCLPGHLNAQTGYPLTENFDSAAAFTITPNTDFSISGGELHWTYYRNRQDQYAYRSIPPFSGDVELTVRGQVSSATNNCAIKVGIGDRPGNGVSIRFGYYGGGCLLTPYPPFGRYMISGGGVSLDHYEISCNFGGNWLWINPNTYYTATLTISNGTATLTSPGVNTSTGTVTYAGVYNTLFIGDTDGYDWPQCSGTIDYVTIKPLLISVDIDIKPGSDPNSINLGSGGTVAVAIFSTAEFDATTINPETVTLSGAPIRRKGNGTPMASIEDINGDGRMDLVVHVSTSALQLSDTAVEAVLEGQTYSGMKIRGTDSVRIVP